MALIMNLSSLRCVVRSFKLQASVNVQRSLSTVTFNHNKLSFVSKPERLIPKRLHHCNSEKMIPQQIPFSSDFFFRQVRFQRESLICHKGQQLSFYLFLLLFKSFAIYFQKFHELFFNKSSKIY